MLITVVVVLATLVLYRPDYIDQALHPLTGFNLEWLRTTGFDMKALLGIIKSVWLHDNWHLLGYLLPVSIALGLILPPATTRTYWSILASLGTAVALFLILFLFTVFSAGAKNFTGVGRLSIQLAPGLLFLTALLCNEILTRDRAESAS